MPNDVGVFVVRGVVHRQQADLKLTPNIGEVIREGAGDWLRGVHCQRFKDLPVVVSLKPFADSLSYRLPFQMRYPIKRLRGCWLSARQKKCPIVEAQHRSQALLREYPGVANTFIL
jgi:hypothetical protein